MRATLPLVEDHEIIHQGLVLLVRVVRSMEAERTPPPSAIKELLKFFRTFVGEYHHAQEEETFFPALELHGFLRNREPMEAMLQEHSSCKAMFEQMTLHMDELSTVDNAAGAFIAAASQYEELLRDRVA